MPDTNCLLTRTSPEDTIQMILQVRHLYSRYVVIPCNFFKKYCGTILSIPLTPGTDSIQIYTSPS